MVLKSCPKVAGVLTANHLICPEIKRAGVSALLSHRVWSLFSRCHDCPAPPPLQKHLLQLEKGSTTKGGEAAKEKVSK